MNEDYSEVPAIAPVIELKNFKMEKALRERGFRLVYDASNQIKVYFRLHNSQK